MTGTAEGSLGERLHEMNRTQKLFPQSEAEIEAPNTAELFTGGDKIKKTPFGIGL